MMPAHNKEVQLFLNTEISITRESRLQKILYHLDNFVRAVEPFDTHK